MYISAITLGLIGLASEGQTLSGIYQQLRDFRAKDKKDTNDDGKKAGKA